MANHSKLIEEDRLERVQSHRGTAKLYDGAYSHVPPIEVRFLDNGTVKCAVLSDTAQGNILYLQGNMVDELHRQWKQNLGDFGASRVWIEKQQKEEDNTLHDVKLTTKQLKALCKLLDAQPTP